MTHLKNHNARKPNHLLRIAWLCATIALCACGKKEEEVVAVAYPVAVKQEVVVESVADVMNRLNIDPRVKMDESERPNTGDTAADLKRLESTLLFFNAMVKGDADKVRPMLCEADRTTLEFMLKDGQWKSATESIDRVTVGCCASQEPETFMSLGVFMTGDHFDAQLWSVKSPGNGEQNSFIAVAAPSQMMEQLRGTKAEPRVQQWMKILKDQADKAKLLDEKVTVAQQDRSIEGEATTESEPSAPGAPSKPSSPEGPGKRKPGGPTVPGPRGPGAPGGAPSGPPGGAPGGALGDSLGD